MTVNSEFQYVHAAAVISRCDESAMLWAVCSTNRLVKCCSKSMTRKPFRIAFVALRSARLRTAM